MEVVEAGGSGQGREGALSHIRGQNICTEKGGHHGVLGREVNFSLAAMDLEC